MTETIQKASIGKRLLALLVDTIIIFPIQGIFMFYIIRNSQNMMLLWWIAFFLYFGLKDIFGGASLGKRLVGLKVKSIDVDKPNFTTLTLFCRNLFTYLWFFELLVLLLSKSKRKIGDMLVKTDVYIVSNKVKTVPIILIIFVAPFVLSIPLILGISDFIKNDDSYRTAIDYIETSEEVRDIVGNIIYTRFKQGNISTSNQGGNAEFTVYAVGERDSANIWIWLKKEPSGNWEIVDVAISIRR
ncbi:MAG: RDD family protein [Oscillospiraceae bacterium]|nr:RDD family protein [Oscillospiraceae bacterium]